MPDYVTRLDAAKIVGRAAGVAVTGMATSIERNRPAPRGSRRPRPQLAAPGEAVFSMPVVEALTSPRYYMPRAAKLVEVVAGVQSGAASVTVSASGVGTVASLSPGSPDVAAVEVDIADGADIEVEVSSFDPDTTGLVVQVRYT